MRMERTSKDRKMTSDARIRPAAPLPTIELFRDEAQVMVTSLLGRSSTEGRDYNRILSLLPVIVLLLKEPTV